MHLGYGEVCEAFYSPLRRNDEAVGMNKPAERKHRYLREGHHSHKIATNVKCSKLIGKLCGIVT